MLLATLALLPTTFQPSCHPSSRSPRAAAPRAAVPAFLPADQVSALSEPACTSMLAAIETVELTLPPSLATGPVGATFVRTSCAPTPGVPPVVLLHSFDSSCLEFRRLLPELEALGVEAYALDIFGWGFADTANAKGVGVDAKRAHLLAFQQSVLQLPCLYPKGRGSRGAGFAARDRP